MPNPELEMTLNDCVEEVLGTLTGLDLSYQPSMDRFRATTRALNRALRAVAREREWSYYASTEEVGTAVAGQQDVSLRATVRPRIIGDDAVRLVDSSGTPRVWAYFLPRDAVNKYPLRAGLWVSIVRQSLHFSRPFHAGEAGLRILVPVMREPRMFRLPDHPTDPEEPLPEVPTSTLEQLLDFDHPDLVILKAAYFLAQSDPVMQPRVQELDAQYKEAFYQLNERDDRHTDSPFLNEWNVPVQSSIFDTSYQDWHHPHADERH